MRHRLGSQLAAIRGERHSVTEESSMQARPVRVFISYAHASAAHTDDVRNLWVLLRQYGIDARLDLPAVEQRQDWPAWMVKEVRAADFVLVIASPEYKRRAEGEVPSDEGRGVLFEARLIRDEVYRNLATGLRKFLPVLLPGSSPDDIPLFLSPASATNYRVTGFNISGIESLLRVLTAQPYEKMPPLGPIPILPPRVPVVPSDSGSPREDNFLSSGSSGANPPELRAVDPKRRRYDVALSFAGAQRGYVEQVASVLKRSGVRCFYDAAEQTMLWGRSLAEDLPRIYSEDSAAVVVFVSAEYAERDWTRLERRSALNRAVRERREYILPARFDDTALPGLLSDMVSVDLRLLSPQEFAQILINKLKDLQILQAIGPDPNREQSIPAPRPQAVWSLPPRLPSFTGREILLQEINEKLHAGHGKPSALVQAFYGLGGVGKTQLAIEYAYRHLDEYILVWWINAEDTALIGEQFANLAGRIGLDVTGDSAKDALTAKTNLSISKEWLLIFDNAPDPAGLRPWLPSGAGHVLITSRNPAWGGLGLRIEIDTLPRSEAAELLRWHVAGLDEDLAFEMASELGDLPLALEQAAAYMEETGVDAASYLTRFRRRREMFLDKGKVTAYGGTVDTAWSLAMDQLSKENRAAVQLLQLCALLAPEPIPLTLFSEHATFLPNPLRSSLSGTDPEGEVDRLVKSIRAYSLVSRTGNTVRLHRLVQSVVRFQLSEEDRAVARKTVSSLLGAATPSDNSDPATWPAWAALGPHLKYVATADSNLSSK